MNYFYSIAAIAVLYLIYEIAGYGITYRKQKKQQRELKNRTNG